MKSFIILSVLFILNVNVQTYKLFESDYADENTTRSLISLIRLQKTFCELGPVPKEHQSNCSEFLTEFNQLVPTKYEKNCFCNDLNKEDEVYWCTCCENIVTIDNQLLDLYKTNSFKTLGYYEWLIEENVNRTVNFDFEKCDTIKIEKKILDLHREIELVKSKSSNDHYLNFYNCVHKSEYSDEFLAVICDQSFKNQLEEAVPDGEEYLEEEISLDLPEEYSPKSEN